MGGKERDAVLQLRARIHSREAAMGEGGRWKREREEDEGAI
jgi:hypothetical protein